MGESRSDRSTGGLPAVEVRPTEPQRRFLERGLTQPGGKLPLFDRDGRQLPRKTVEARISHGWAEPWSVNPIKPDWIVCKLTPRGYRALGVAPAVGARGRE